MLHILELISCGYRCMLLLAEVASLVRRYSVLTQLQTSLWSCRVVAIFFSLDFGTRQPPLKRPRRQFSTQSTFVRLAEMADDKIYINFWGAGQLMQALGIDYDTAAAIVRRRTTDGRTRYTNKSQVRKILRGQVYEAFRLWLNIGTPDNYPPPARAQDNRNEVHGHSVQVILQQQITGGEVNNTYPPRTRRRCSFQDAPRGCNKGNSCPSSMTTTTASNDRTWSAETVGLLLLKENVIARGGRLKKASQSIESRGISLCNSTNVKSFIALYDFSRRAVLLCVVGSAASIQI